jgi:RAB protein geranylgeranyltransferase component A
MLSSIVECVKPEIHYHDLGNYIRKSFTRGTTMMGGTFIINATIVGGNFRDILILMHLGVWKKKIE